MALLYTPRIDKRLGADEMYGLMNLLDDRVLELCESGDDRARYYTGAWVLLYILRKQDKIDYPRDFMALFDNFLDGRRDDESGD